MTQIENATIRAAGSRVAKAQLDSEKKPMVSMFENIEKHVKTKQDVSDFLSGYADYLAENGKTDGSVRAMKSRAKRIASVMTATDKKLNEFFGIDTPEQGIELIKQLMGQCSGITEVYEALSPNAKAEALDTENDTEHDPETTEPTEADKSTLGKLFAGFIQQAHEHGYTNDEISEYLKTLSL